MATVLTHRKVNIVLLAEGEALHGHCRAGDIAIVAEDGGWWLKFVGRDGHVDSYDAPYATYNAALWAAKAAAEFGVD